MIIFELLSQQTIMSVGQLLDYFTRCLNNPKLLLLFRIYTRFMSYELKRILNYEIYISETNSVTSVCE